MNAPVLRNSCGTFLGSLLHQDKGEWPCAACAEAAVRRLAEEPARNRAVLEHALSDEPGTLRAAA